MRLFDTSIAVPTPKVLVSREKYRYLLASKESSPSTRRRVFRLVERRWKRITAYTGWTIQRRYTISLRLIIYSSRFLEIGQTITRPRAGITIMALLCARTRYTCTGPGESRKTRARVLWSNKWIEIDSRYNNNIMIISYRLRAMVLRSLCNNVIHDYGRSDVMQSYGELRQHYYRYAYARSTQVSIPIVNASERQGGRSRIICARDVFIYYVSNSVGTKISDYTWRKKNK